MPPRPKPGRAREPGPAELPSSPDLPHYGTRFFGRENELGILGASLSEAERLISIIGTGGVGKTRFVVEFLSTRQPTMDCVFCDLADARTLAEALSQIAVRVGLRLSQPISSDAMLELLGRAVRKRGEVVVVLDNFEQLVGKTDGLLETLLRAAPKVRIVVTSRLRLSVTGERVMELDPLPTRSHVPNEPSPALRLFRDRVALATGDFDAELSDASDSAELVRELDGLPLAIELLAPRARTLGTREIRARLPRGLALDVAPFAAGKRTSVRAALEGSWSLLADAERSVLAKASVFRGGFTASAVEAVVSESEAFPPAIDVLQRLRDHCLVYRVGGASKPSVRLSLLTVIRDFAAEKAALVPHELDLAVERHAAFYAELFSTARAAEQSGDPSELDRLLEDRDNLIAVAERANQPSASMDLVRLGLSALAVLDVLVFTKGIALTHAEVLESLPEKAFMLARSSMPGLLRAGFLERGLFARARARLVGGRGEEARSDLETLVELARSNGDRTYEGRALYLLASHAVRSGHATNEVELYERALALHRAEGDRTYEGRCLIGLGAHALANGRTDEAIELSESALLLFVKLGDKSYEALVRASLANIHTERGEYEKSRAHLEKALEVHQWLGHLRFEAFDHYGLGLLEHGLGHFEEALASYEMASAICQDVGDLRYAAAFRGYAGLCLATLGRVERAHDRLNEAREALRESGDATYAAFFSACAAGVLALGGRLDAAREAFDRADAELAQTQLSSMGKAFAVLRGTLDLGPMARGGDPLLRAERERRVREMTAARAPDEPKDLRFARAWLRAALKRSIATEEPAGALRIHDQGHWFELPDGTRIPAGARQAMGRILLALATHRLAMPGEALSRAALIRAGWPEERILPSVEANRLHVTIRRLRKLWARCSRPPMLATGSVRRLLSVSFLA